MFNQEQADKICHTLATHPVSLQSILRKPGMPSSAQVYEWLQENPTFAANYAQARDRQADTDADEIANLRQRVLDGDITPEQGRVAIDTLKWSAGKRAPKRYGDKIIQEGDHKLTIELIDATKRD